MSTIRIPCGGITQSEFHVVGPLSQNSTYKSPYRIVCTEGEVSLSQISCLLSCPNLLKVRVPIFVLGSHFVQGPHFSSMSPFFFNVPIFLQGPHFCYRSPSSLCLRSPVQGPHFCSGSPFFFKVHTFASGPQFRPRSPILRQVPILCSKSLFFSLSLYLFKISSFCWRSQATSLPQRWPPPPTSSLRQSNVMQVLGD